MSASMVLGRILLPASAVVLLVGVAWNAVAPGKADRDRPTSGPVERRAEVRVTAEGRVVAYPGGEVTVGSEVLGTIVAMPARERQTVRRGELLAQLRDDEVRASLAEARLRLTESEAALKVERARAGLDRLLPGFGLSRPGAVPSPMRNDLLTAYQARRDAARAAIDRLEADSARYRIVAPIDGVVIGRHADPGETVSPAAPIVTIADLKRLHVEAEVDEFDIPRLAVDASAIVRATGYRPEGWRGRVEEVADAVVPRRGRPEDPARPADTRVLVVRIELLEATPLRLGQRVEVEIGADDDRGTRTRAE